MNVTTLCFGLAMIAYGATTIVLRVVRPRLFWKLEPMKKFWGPRLGLWIHVVGYSLLPIVAGLLFTIRGIQGASIF